MPSRRKDIGLGRRRIREEDEAEVGGEAEFVEDSASENSGLSDEEEDDENDSEATLSDDEDHNNPDTVDLPKTNGKPHTSTTAKSEVAVLEPGKGDTHAMLNGLKGDDTAQVVEFDDINGGEEELPKVVAKSVDGRRRKSQDVHNMMDTTTSETNGQAMDTTTQATQETVFEKRRREHEEYRKKRDADPAFVPNRGAFFMHDHRSGAGGANGFRPFGRGRGRGDPVGLVRLVFP